MDRRHKKAVLSDMPDSRRRDMIVRGIDGQYVVIDLATEERLAGPVKLSVAIQLAKAAGATALWQENTDESGRALGTPIRIPLA